MLREFRSMWDGFPRHIEGFKHRIDFISDEIQPAHSTPYRAGRTTKQMFATETSCMNAEKMIESGTNKWAASLVIVS